MKTDQNEKVITKESTAKQDFRRPETGETETGPEAKIINLLNIIKRRQRWFIAAFGIVITYVGYNTLKERALNPVYQGSFQILLRDPIDAQPGERGGANSLQSTTPATADPRIRISNIPDLITVLTSPAILHPLATAAGMPPNALDGRVDIYQPNPRTDGILQIDLRWNNPEEGKKLIRKVATGYIDYSIQQRQIRLARGIQFLDEQTPILQSRVNSLQQQLANFRRTNAFLEPEERARQIAGKMSETESKLSTLETQYLQLQSLRAAVVKGQLVSPAMTGSSPVPSGGTGAASGVGEPLVPTSAFSQLLDSLISVEKEIAEVSGSFKANSPVIQSLIAKRNKIRPLLQRRELDSIDASLRENVDAQTALRSQYQSLYNVFRIEGPDLVKKYQSLTQRLNVANDNLTSYIRQRESIRLEMAQQSQPWQVIQGPSFASNPVKPNIRKELQNGLIFALLAGVSVSVLRDRFDRVFHNTQELEAAINTPLLGTIPYIEETPTSVIGELENKDSKQESPSSWRLRESVRNLYASLKIIRAGRNIRVLAITSVSANEGKTTTAALLGKSFSELGIKVLLIDGDMRKIQLHESLQLENTKGFSDLFANRNGNIESLMNWVTPNLAVITGGYRPPDPAALLSSERLSEIVNQLKWSETFDLILVDTPPALDLVDPILISRDLDGLLLLVALGKTDKALLAKTIRRIEAAQIDLIGIVCKESADSVSVKDYAYYNYEPDLAVDKSQKQGQPAYVKASLTKAKELLTWLDKRR